MYAYMKITKDRYELPLAVADSPSELVAMTGDSINTVIPQISRAKSGDNRYGRNRFLKVELEQDEQKNVYDEVRLTEIWKENREKGTRAFCLREFLEFCYEWETACERLRATKKRRVRTREQLDHIHRYLKSLTVGRF